MRDILHFSVPAFPVAVARVVDPSLASRPVAVAPGNSERALVQSVSAEALAEGVREGMPIYRARRFCPSLSVLPPDPLRVGRAMRALVDITADYTPLWEPERSGRLYLDLTGSGRLLGPGRDVATRLEKEVVDRLRLPAAVGVATNKLVSRIASGFLEKPGVCDVLRGSERSFIGPLPVSVLPGIGRTRAGVLLDELNLRLVKELAALSLPQIRLAFGSSAPLLRQRALGVDPSPVRPPARDPEVAEESFLPREENDDELLLAELCRLVERCAHRLRRQGAGARRLSLSLHYADGVRQERSLSLPRLSSSDRALMQAAESLFGTACTRRVRVKGMRLQFSGLGRQEAQMELFAEIEQEEAPPREASLQDALDKLRKRHGMDVVKRGKGLR